MFAQRPLDIAASDLASSIEDETETPAPQAPTLDKTLYSAARNNVPDNDPATVATLTTELERFLANPQAAVRILPQDAVAFIAATNVLAAEPAAHTHAMGNPATAQFSREKTIATLRRMIAAPQTPVAPEIDWWKTKGLAAIALAWDHSPASSRLVLTLARNPAAPVETRAAALNSLRNTDAPVFEHAAFVLASDHNNAPALRANAIAAIGAYTTDHGLTLTVSDRARLGAALDRLGKLKLPPQAQAALDSAKRLLALAH